VKRLIQRQNRSKNPSPSASLPSTLGRGERSQTRFKVPSHQHARRGSIIVFAMLALLILSMLGAALLRTVMLSQRQLQRETLHTQTGWLADAGIARAVARLRAASDYTGETWAIPSEQLSSGRTASVRITVSLAPDQPGQAWIAATAEYPSGSPTAIRITKRITVATR